MLPRILAPLLLALVTLVVPSGAAVADPYAPQIPTRTTITVQVGKVGEPLVLSLRVTANAERQPKGSLDVTLGQASPTARGAQSAPADWSTTVRYDGGSAIVEGPVLDEGTYLVTADFTPDGQVFLPSDDSTRFTLGAGGGDGDDDEDDGGLLPDTGGPAVLWLLLGLALVGGGAGVVVYARRKQAAAVPSA